MCAPDLRLQIARGTPCGAGTRICGPPRCLGRPARVELAQECRQRMVSLTETRQERGQGSVGYLEEIASKKRLGVLVKRSEEALLGGVPLRRRGGPTGSNCREVTFGSFRALLRLEAAPQLLDSSGNPENLGATKETSN